MSQRDRNRRYGQTTDIFMNDRCDAARLEYNLTVALYDGSLPLYVLSTPDF